MGHLRDLPKSTMGVDLEHDFEPEYKPIKGKESIIKDEGVPFATLLWLRGHITLYIGEYKGEPVMFHNVWGVRTDDGNGEGRHIIGRAVVTSLQPGAELPNVRRENLILSRLKGMSVLRYD